MSEIEEWKSRPLCKIYSIIFIDALYFSVRQENVVKKLVAYVVRGIRDIMIICADGLSGMNEAIATAFPETEYQRCIVHQVRNTLKHVSYKDMKSFAADLKMIYHAPTEKIGHERMESVTKKWESSYPNAMKSWDLLCPIFKFSSEVRKMIYITNAIESLNSTYRKLNS